MKIITISAIISAIVSSFLNYYFRLKGGHKLEERKECRALLNEIHQKNKEVREYAIRYYQDVNKYLTDPKYHPDTPFQSQNEEINFLNSELDSMIQILPFYNNNKGQIMDRIIAFRRSTSTHYFPPNHNRSSDINEKISIDNVQQKIRQLSIPLRYNLEQIFTQYFKLL